MNAKKVLITVLAAVVLASGTLPAEAKVGGSTSSISSSARTSTSSRIGSGVSSGMTRPSVTAQARQAQNYGNVGVPRNTYISPTVITRPGYTGAQMGAAVVAGAAVGALTANTMPHNNSYVTHEYGYSPQSNDFFDIGMGGDVDGGLVLGTVLLLLIGVVGCVWAYKVFSSPKTSNYTAAVPLRRSEFSSSHTGRVEDDLSHAHELLSTATSLFSLFQDVNNKGDIDTLSRIATVEYAQGLIHEIRHRREPSQTQVLTINVVGQEVLGYVRESTRYVGSIHFKGVISEGFNQPNEPLDEVWHFVKYFRENQWRLAGIEPV